jgi:hypothetical protein
VILSVVPLQAITNHPAVNTVVSSTPRQRIVTSGNTVGR